MRTARALNSQAPPPNIEEVCAAFLYEIKVQRLAIQRFMPHKPHKLVKFPHDPCTSPPNVFLVNGLMASAGWYGGCLGGWWGELVGIWERIGSERGCHIMILAPMYVRY